ncbi:MULTISPECIES: hypothetical protein [Brucella]|uniref:Uncharacterized protein n=2 Tax=root TaxID=1 RepID=A0A219VHD0_9CAUD|nr:MULTISPECIES: hypothetical protein [Brucella]YP_010665133.1 hypothetical protein PQB33_gp50 [Ochrobactrum phage POA1180]HCH72910.1 hypothetical protein [Ochrobactrum sp.]AOT25358.1 hypothetical protein POA1180_50 [Ochrobactrum phage POA1180]EEQ96356.1 Hypothetical protein OINT_1001783 [Brucella intermedia LMG 3301]KAB2691990.1 hypothetical protein F9K82_08760 [Brucella pseudogrignonensis]NKB95726.1 hypothetical protein [Brucella intermedia]
MTNSVRVTDHAVLRYLEREHGLDVDAVRNHIAGLAATGVQLEAISVKVERVKLLLCGETVVTVLKRNWPSDRRS